MGQARDYTPETYDAGDVEERPRRHDALMSAVTHALIFLGGALLGLIGSFEFSWELGGFPIAAVGITVANFAGFWLAGWAMGSKLAVLTAITGWLIVVLLLAMQRPSGSLVVTGTAAGYLFLFGGAVVAIAASYLTKQTRRFD